MHSKKSFVLLLCYFCIIISLSGLLTIITQHAHLKFPTGLQQLHVAIKIACQGGGCDYFSVEIPTAEISGIGVGVRCLVLGVCKNEITNACGVGFVSIKHKAFI